MYQKEEKFLETIRMVDKCLVYVYQFLASNSNFEIYIIKSFKFPVVINFTNPLRKLFIPKYSHKSPKNLQNSPKNVDMWNELRDV